MSATAQIGGCGGVRSLRAIFQNSQAVGRLDLPEDSNCPCWASSPTAAGGDCSHASSTPNAFEPVALAETSTSASTNSPPQPRNEPTLPTAHGPASALSGLSMASVTPENGPRYACERTACLFRGYERMTAEEVAPPASRLQTQLHSIFSSSEYSDLIIRTRDGEELKAHKAIVCAACDFFKNALSNDFKEAKTGVIEMPNDPPHVVHAFLSYLYYEDYAMSNDVFSHVEIYIVGSVYRVRGLKRLALLRFIAEFRSKHHKGDDVYKLISLVHDSLPESDNFIRGPVALYSAVHLSTLLLDAEFAAALAQHDDFRIEVVNKFNELSQLFDTIPCAWTKETFKQAPTKLKIPKASGSNSA